MAGGAEVNPHHALCIIVTSSIAAILLPYVEKSNNHKKGKNGANLRMDRV